MRGITGTTVSSPKTILDRFSNLLLLSLAGSIGLTALSLARYIRDVDDGILWLDQSARGYPFYFLEKTYFSIMPQVVPLGYHVIISALLADIVSWFLVSLALLTMIRMLMLRSKFST